MFSKSKSVLSLALTIFIFLLFLTISSFAYDCGDVNCSGGAPDISDITCIIDHLYLRHIPLCDPLIADVNNSGGNPDISDITGLIDNLYLSHSPLNCPSTNDPSLIGSWSLVSVNGAPIIPDVFLIWTFTATTVTVTSDMDCVEVIAYSSTGGVITGLSVISQEGSECGDDDGGGELGSYSVVETTLTVTMYDPEMEPPTAVFVFTKVY